MKKLNSSYRKRDILRSQDRETISKAIADFSQQKLSHLYTITQTDIKNVLDAIGWYLSEPKDIKTWRMNKYVRKAKPAVFSEILLTMLQIEHNACGMRIEMWTL
jgi:hypothetical protein